jgi:hypothetical protein
MTRYRDSAVRGKSRVYLHFAESGGEQDRPRNGGAIGGSDPQPPAVRVRFRAGQCGRSTRRSRSYFRAALEKEPRRVAPQILAGIASSPDVVPEHVLSDHATQPVPLFDGMMEVHPAIARPEILQDLTS